mmetsp:Transcript_101653/g.201885  ORF Transcript_101653/g.201885 Transcript_101653/m.201885 type:complete len:412 (-) Transcript_101653:106-1341(-)
MATKDSKNVGNPLDLEKQPLKNKDLTGGQSFGSVDVGRIKLPDAHQDDIAWDCSQYDGELVNNWKILGYMAGGAFDNLSILKCMACSMVVSCFVAYLTYNRKEALFIKPSKVEELGTFLNVFVGFLLGFFLRSSMTRWHECVHAFMDLLEAIRCMHMQMCALGVDADRVELLNRYGLLSAWLLHLSLNSDSHKNPTRQDSLLADAAQKEALWGLLNKYRPHLAQPAEKELLFPYNDCYSLLWTWAASLIGRMAQDGEIPPMASPTYGRIINIIEVAYGSIRDVKIMRKVKAPFIYTHTLACLVHFNTLINSWSFGIILGMTLQVALGKHDGSLQEEFPHLVVSLFMQLCISMVAPWMYLTVLEVCVCVSQPFTFLDTKIPGLHLIENLEDDLANASVMVANTKWMKPRFQK